MHTIIPRFNILITNRPSSNLSHGNYGDMVTIVLLNDDITGMSYVVRCLVEVFDMSETYAKNTMRMAHKRGDSLVGIYSKNLAEEKMKMVRKMNKSNGENLKFMIGC